MKKYLLAAVVASAILAADVPQATAGPLRNLIRKVIHRPQAASVTQVASAPATTYVASCAGCQSNSGTSGIVWASGGTCDNGICTK